MPLNWIKSSRSHEVGCVELATAPSEVTVLVRDSKDPNGPVLHFTPHEMRVFLEAAKAGEFDHLAYGVEPLQRVVESQVGAD